MLITEYLAREFKRVLIALILLAIFLFTTILSLQTYNISKNDLKKSLDNIGNVTSSVVFENNSDLLIRNLNAISKSQGLTNVEINSLNTGKVLYKNSIEKNGLIKECIIKDWSNLFRVKVCSYAFEDIFLNKLMFFLIALIVLSYSLYKILEKRARTVFDEYNQDIKKVFLGSINEDVLRFEETRRISKLYSENFYLKSRIAEDEAVYNLSKNIAHDLRSPLTLLEVLAETESYDRNIFLSAVDRIKDICNGLLRENTNKLEYINLHDLIKKILQFKTQEHGISNAQFEILVDGNVWANRTSLERIFSNVINNSIEAKTNLLDLFIKIYTVNTEEFVEIIFEDNGGGVNESVLSNLGKQEITTKITGNGLGILSMKKYMDSIGGEFKVRNIKNVGCALEFKFYSNMG